MKKLFMLALLVAGVMALVVLVAGTAQNHGFLPWRTAVTTGGGASRRATEARPLSRDRPTADQEPHGVRDSTGRGPTAHFTQSWSSKTPHCGLYW